MLPHNINQAILPFSQSYVKQKNCHFQEKYILPSCAKRVQGCIMLLLILTAEDKQHV